MQRRRAELLSAQEQIQNCLEQEDYSGAAAADDNMAALIRAEPCSPRNQGCSKADCSAATATGPIVASAALARREEEESCEEVPRQWFAIKKGYEHHVKVKVMVVTQSS